MSNVRFQNPHPEGSLEYLFWEVCDLRQTLDRMEEDIPECLEEALGSLDSAVDDYLAEYQDWRDEPEEEEEDDYRPPRAQPRRTPAPAPLFEPAAGEA